MSEKYDALIADLQALQSPDDRIAAFAKIRDIPYGDIGSRNALDVLLNNKGTCSGKHALLKLCLTSLGYEVQSWFARHNFGEFPIKEWPEELQRFQKEDIPDYHDFLKVLIDDQWRTIDAIFDKPMEAFGFPVQNWDGKSDMLLPVRSTNVFPAEENFSDHKSRLIEELPLEKQKLRKDFLAALTKWINAQRSDPVSAASPKDQ